MAVVFSTKKAITDTLGVVSSTASAVAQGADTVAEYTKAWHDGAKTYRREQELRNRERLINLEDRVQSEMDLEEAQRQLSLQKSLQNEDLLEIYNRVKENRRQRRQPVAVAAE